MGGPSWLVACAPRTGSTGGVVEFTDEQGFHRSHATRSSHPRRNEVACDIASPVRLQPRSLIRIDVACDVDPDAMCWGLHGGDCCTAVGRRENRVHLRGRQGQCALRRCSRGRVRRRFPPRVRWQGELSRPSSSSLTLLAPQYPRPAGRPSWLGEGSCWSPPVVRG